MKGYLKKLILFFYNFCFHTLQKFRFYGFKQFILFKFLNFYEYVKTFQKNKNYKILKKKDILNEKQSNTLFIFGSGYSLNSISKKEWEYFEKNDTLGFSHFLRQKWIHCRFHLIRGWKEGWVSPKTGKITSTEIINIIGNNNLYKDTIFIIQNEMSAITGNSILNKKLSNSPKKIFKYKTNFNLNFPDRSEPNKFCHNNGTLFDALSFGYLMEWEKIILVGVDLYDSRYFFLKNDETFKTDFFTGEQKPSINTNRGSTFNKPHSTYKKNLIDLMNLWSTKFKENHVKLYVYNPKSLLTKILPIYKIKL